MKTNKKSNPERALIQLGYRKVHSDAETLVFKKNNIEIHFNHIRLSWISFEEYHGNMIPVFTTASTQKAVNDMLDYLGYLE